MVEFNPNLRPDGKRRWSKRKGLTNPAERMNELWEEEQNKANESRSFLTSIKKKGNSEDKISDLPLDNADKMQLYFESLLNKEEKK